MILKDTVIYDWMKPKRGTKRTKHAKGEDVSTCSINIDDEHINRKSPQPGCSVSCLDKGIFTLMNELNIQLPPPPVEEEQVPQWKQNIETVRGQFIATSQEQQELFDRVIFFISPESGENAKSLTAPIRPMWYYYWKAEDLEYQMEKEILLRMNPNAMKKVTWRQQMNFTMPADYSALIFLQNRLAAGKSIMTQTVRKYYVEGEMSEPINLNIFNMQFKLTDNNIPSLANKYWYLKKWTGNDGVIWRSVCFDFTLVYKLEIGKIRVEFEYFTQFYNTKLDEPAWQYY